jgi:hypothetical protein
MIGLTSWAVIEGVFYILEIGLNRVHERPAFHRRALESNLADDAMAFISPGGDLCWSDHNDKCAHRDPSETPHLVLHRLL